jgi:Acetyltransferase (GNAT) domain
MLFVSRDVTGISTQYYDTPVYMQDWLIEAAGSEPSARRVIVEEDGELLGSLSFCLVRNSVGMKQIYNLPWTRVCGPSIPEEMSAERKADIVRQLIRQLPRNASCFLRLAREFDVKLFLQEGFRSDLETNYFIPPDAPQNVYVSFSKMTKRHIKQAERDLVVSSTTADRFFDIYSADLIRRRRKPSAPLTIARDILAEGQRLGQARVFIASRCDTGETEAAIACLWDNARYYYWMTTRRLDSNSQTKPHQGAIKLLLWSAIQDASTRGLIFDFDGTDLGCSAGIDGKIRLYEGMGARRCFRYAVTRETKMEQALGRFRPIVKSAIRNTLGRVIPLKLNH